MTDQELIAWQSRANARFARMARKRAAEERDSAESVKAVADRISAQAAEIERLRGDLKRALDALHEAWFMLTVPMLNYEPEPEEPGLRRIKDTLAELTGESHE